MRYRARGRPILLLAFLSLVYSTLASGSQAGSRIVDGQRVPESQYPTVGRVSSSSAINQPFPNNHFCTGTLIAPNAVLTAAHCVGGMGNTDGRFILGGKTYSTVAVHVHPKYKPNAQDEVDLAVMILSENVAGVTPSVLNRQAPTVGTELTIVGYGLEGTGQGGTNNDVPPEGFVNVGKTPLDELTSNLLIWEFGPGESNTAPGDSGGPAFVTRNSTLYLAGVTSGGDKQDASHGDRSYDARVDTETAWIDGIAGNGGGGGGGGDTPTITITSSLSYSPQAPAPGDTVTFTVSASHSQGATLSYSWDFGDGSTGSGSSATHTYSTAGSYTVTVTVSAATGTPATDSAQVSVGEGELTPTRASVRLNFMRDGRDSMKFMSQLELLDRTTLAGTRLQFNLAGITGSVVLDHRGKGTSGTIKVKARSRGSRADEPLPAGSLVDIRISYNRSTFNPNWTLDDAPFGFWTTATFDCSVTLDGTGYLAQQQQGFYKESNTKGRFNY